MYPVLLTKNIHEMSVVTVSQRARKAAISQSVQNGQFRN
jgi:hypothetical protein